MSHTSPKSAQKYNNFPIYANKNAKLQQDYT